MYKIRVINIFNNHRKNSNEMFKASFNCKFIVFMFYMGVYKENVHFFVYEIIFYIINENII